MPFDTCISAKDCIKHARWLASRDRSYGVLPTRALWFVVHWTAVASEALPVLLCANAIEIGRVRDRGRSRSGARGRNGCWRRSPISLGMTHGSRHFARELIKLGRQGFLPRDRRLSEDFAQSVERKARVVRAHGARRVVLGADRLDPRGGERDTTLLQARNDGARKLMPARAA